MNLSFYYWWFKAALPERICDEILEFGKSTENEEAWTGGKLIGEEHTPKELDVVKRKRISKVSWLNESWIYKELHPFVHEANRRAGWNFEWDQSEKIQFTKYDEGHFYSWHSDSFPKPYDGKKGDTLNGKIRKLSVTVSLSNPDEYDGGNLEFDFRNGKDYEFDKSNFDLCTEIRPKGSIIVFPSFVWHRVTPITRGTRYSLVTWNCGQPWR